MIFLMIYTVMHPIKGKCVTEYREIEEATLLKLGEKNGTRPLLLAEYAVKHLQVGEYCYFNGNTFVRIK